MIRYLLVFLFWFSRFLVVSASGDVIKYICTQDSADYYQYRVTSTISELLLPLINLLHLHYTDKPMLMYGIMYAFSITMINLRQGQS